MVGALLTMSALSACGDSDTSGEPTELEEYDVVVNVFDNADVCGGNPETSDVGRCGDILYGKVHAYSQDGELLASGSMDVPSGKVYRTGWQFKLSWEAEWYGTVWFEMDGCDNTNPWGSTGYPTTYMDNGANFSISEAADGTITGSSQSRV
ncbi:hypothetical protein L615_007000000020 [Nocardioides sp. J9]|nr:hypothetical protein L615_007000000020 [Nocardioides sp. J9]